MTVNSLKCETVVPVAGKVRHAVTRQNGVDPRQHEFPCWQPTSSDLVPQYQVPDQSQNQLQVTLENVLGACDTKQR